ncbi:AAA family ATPase [Patescibacteria group bacterium]|nr:AAA family ATPase [Patescibacteria group bacterium]
MSEIDVPTPVESQDEAQLPTLKFKKVFQSKEPIAGNAKDLIAAEKWGEYTIVLRKPILSPPTPIPELGENPRNLPKQEPLIIIDGEGREVVDFGLISGLEVTVSIKEYCTSLRKSYVCDDEYDATKDDIYVKTLPKHFQKKAQEAINKENRHWIDVNDILDITSKLSSDKTEISLYMGGKYVVLFDPCDKGWIAYLTQNEAGVSQIPRNWKRFDAGAFYEIPEELSVHINKLKEETKIEGNVVELSGEYEVRVGGTKLQIRQGPNVVHEETLAEVGDNVCVDPSNPSMVYFCRSENPEELYVLDISESLPWTSRQARFPKQYSSIKNLGFHPSGKFLTFLDGKNLVLLSKSTLEEIGRIEGGAFAQWDEQGRMRTLDSKGHFIVVKFNLDKIDNAIQARRVAELARGVDIEAMFEGVQGPQSNESAGEGDGQEDFSYLDEFKAKAIAVARKKLSRANDLTALDVIGGQVNVLETQLAGQGLDSAAVAYVSGGVIEMIEKRKTELAEPVVREALGRVRAMLASLSVRAISEIREDLSELDGLLGSVEVEVRDEVRDVRDGFRLEVARFFEKEAGKIKCQVNSMVEKARNDLDGFESKRDFDEWLHDIYPAMRRNLGELEADCPLEATEAHEAITLAKTTLRDLADQYEKRFEMEYAAVRERAAEHVKASADDLKKDIARFLKGLKRKGFKSRTDAERYINESSEREMIEDAIGALGRRNEELANSLSRQLKSDLALAVDAIERGKATTVVESGEQMVDLGGVAFPRFEAKVKRKEMPTVTPTFVRDQRTVGPGVKPADVYGDICLRVKDAHGKVKVIRLFEGRNDEDEWRNSELTGIELRGGSVKSSYMQHGDFAAFRKQFLAWGTEDAPGVLRVQYEEKREAVKECYARRHKVGERGTEDVHWQLEYRRLLEEYANFCSENNIALLRQVDRQLEAECAVDPNGKGVVPEWKSDWTSDSLTEEYLADMARNLNLQRTKKEGLLMLAGHAGTGKDVLVQMFCNLTNRPYAGFNCTKWTTEADLVEDVQLESVDGSVRTVKVPSIIARAIQTDGSVVYLNEFNAMPHTAQLAIHSLLDAKRILIPPTSPDKPVKAVDSVLFVASMNEDYEGTEDPNFATKSRMSYTRIGYPPLTRPAAKEDPNQNPLFDSAEALRIARWVSSLIDLTWEPQADRNAFVKMWDKYINGTGDGQTPTPEQKFDLDVILSLVQFGAHFRDSFIAKFNRSHDRSARNLRKKLPVEGPLTMREMTSAAWYLSDCISSEEKLSGKLNPEEVAKMLLTRYYIVKTKSEADRDTMERTLDTDGVFAMQKRLEI